MSTAESSIGSALAALWQRHRQTNLDRITVLESATASILRELADDEAIEEAVGAAHKLAGSLGTFGFDAGSRAALEAEALLKQPIIDARLLAEAVNALRSAVEEVRANPQNDSSSPSSSPSTSTSSLPAEPPKTTGSVVHLVSDDPELASRLTIEATAAGLSLEVSAPGSLVPATGGDGEWAVVVDAESASTWSQLLDDVATSSAEAPVVVLTERDSFEDRIALARAGAAGLVPRRQSARQTIAFLLELWAARQHITPTVLVAHQDPRFLQRAGDALSGRGCTVVVLDDSADLWEILEREPIELVLADAKLPAVSGVELCRAIRADRRWHRLPVVLVGERRGGTAHTVLAAGADDFVSPSLSAQELASRVHNQVARARLLRTLGDVDSLTGVENRRSVERSLDRLVNLAARRGDHVAIARIDLDRLAQINEREGHAMGDIVLRRLGTQLIESFRREDVIGRWQADEFIVGMYGADRQQGNERITAVLEAFVAEQFRTTSGGAVHHAFSAGIAAFPADGTTVASLERTAENALRRAKLNRARVVLAGGSADSTELDVLDVVLVEDDDSIADVIEHALNLRGHRFRRFVDGAEAAAALGEGQVRGRLVLLDVGLPSLDGFGVLRTLRDRGVLESTQVVMLTARSSEQEMLRGLGLGATDHMTKPFSVPLLLKRIDQVLGRAER